MTIRASSKEMACDTSPIASGDGSAQRSFRGDHGVRAGTKADLAEISQDLGDLFGDAVDSCDRADLELREWHAGAGGVGAIDRRNRMAVRADLRFAEHDDEPFFDAGRDRMLEAAGLGVNLVPRHPQDLRQQTLRQTMAPEDSNRNGESALGQLRRAARGMNDVSFPGELLQHPGRRMRARRRVPRPDQRSSPRALALETVDRLEVLLGRLIEVRVRHADTSIRRNAEVSAPTGRLTGMVAIRILRFARRGVEQSGSSSGS